MGDTFQKITDWVEFVNSQSAYHKRQVERICRRKENGKVKPELKRQEANHQRVADQFDQLASFLESIGESPASNSPQDGEVVSPSLHFMPEDLVGLPPEILDQLNISESDELELDIYEALEKAGGTLNILKDSRNK